MADLQVCYFCGSGPDDSLGEYAVVPSDLHPTDEQQRSVVLCPSCREKLTKVMEPVVDAATGDVDDSGLGDPSPHTGPDDTASSGPSTGEASTGEASTGEPSAGESPAGDPGGLAGATGGDESDDADES